MLLQMILLMALADGTSAVRVGSVNRRTQAAMRAVQAMTEVSTGEVFRLAILAGRKELVLDSLNRKIQSAHEIYFPP